MSPRANPLPAAERRAAIIAAARPIVQAQGGNYTTKQVAEAAGIAEGTIFRIFATKSDLTDAVIDDFMDPTPLCTALAAINPAHGLRQRITGMIEALVAAATEISTVFAALCQQPSPEEPKTKPPHKHHRRHREQAEQLAAAMVAVLEPHRDELRCSPHQAAALIRSVAFGAAHPQSSLGETTTAEQLAELLLDGLVLKDVPC